MDAAVPISPAPLLSWTAVSIPHHERSQRWYLIGGVAVLAITVYGVLTGAWTMSLLAMLLGGLYFMLRSEKPTISQISILEKGFTLDGIFTPWNACSSFWLIHTPGYSELHIWRTAGKPQDAVIQTGDIDMTLIRATLSHFVQERADRKEQLLDKTIRLLKL